MSVQSNDGRKFDAIVFGEREPRRWMAGSEGYSRTQSFGEGEENSNLGSLILIYEPLLKRLFIL